MALLLLGLAGCAKAEAQLIVWVGTDLAPARIGVLVGSKDLEPLYQDTLAARFPFSFAVTPGASYLAEEVLVRVQALDASGGVLGERSAVVGFVEGERRLLPLFIAARCATARCGGTDDVCTERGCESVFVNASSLARIEPGDELTHDAGTPRGVDAATPVERDGGAPSDLDSGTSPGTDGGIGPLDRCGCGATEICAHRTEIRGCAPPDDCMCVERCDPFAGSACTGTRRCTILDPNGPIAGGCLEPRPGLALGQACTSSFAAGRKISDDCNRTNNLICPGTYPGMPRSVCTLYCKVSDPTCPPQNVCAPNLPPSSPMGTCGREPLTFPDTTRFCSTNMGCQSGLCMFQKCASKCSSTATCPLDSACITIADREPFCAQLCERDSECPGTWVCQDYGPKVCVPMCSDSGFCPLGQQCNNGHCS